MSKQESNSINAAVERYVTTRDLMERRNVCDRTIDRWLEDSKLNFPKPQRINKRRYWKLSEIVAWERERDTTAPHRSQKAEVV